MNYKTLLNIKHQYEGFVKQSRLDVLVPRILSAQNESESQRRQHEARSEVFFDEILTVNVVLHTAFELSAELLQYLELSIAAHATTSTQDGSVPTTVSKHELASVKINATSHQALEKVGTSFRTTWIQQLHVKKPRSRMQHPSVYFTANLALKREILEQNERAAGQLLPSFQPLSPNVLEPLRLSGADSETSPYLTETRITKITPHSPSLDESLKPLRGTTKKTFPAVPAILPRLRYTALSDKILLSVEIEVPQDTKATVTLQSLSISIPGTRTKQIGKPGLEAVMQAGDELDTIYEIVQNPGFGALPEKGIVSTEITAAVQLVDGSSAQLELSWETQIDMKLTDTKEYHRWMIDTRDDARPKDADLSKAVSFSFFAPESVVKGSTFDVLLSCINRSGRARRFAIETSMTNGTSNLTAISATPYVTMTGIGPGECYETVLKYTALSVGMLDLGFISIIDLDSHESIEVQRLPDVVALEQ